MKIRLAETKDVQRICEIVSQMTPGLLHDYRLADEKFEKTIKNNPDYFLWVAELDGEVVGTATMHLQHKLSNHCGTAGHLEDVVVDKDHRNLGIGKKLVEKATQTAKDHHCYKLMLTASKSVPYYEKIGFVSHDIGMRMSLIPDEHPKETV